MKNRKELFGYMIFYLMIIISILYLLFRENIVDLKDLKTILFGMLYIDIV